MKNLWNGLLCTWLLGAAACAEPGHAEESEQGYGNLVPEGVEADDTVEEELARPAESSRSEAPPFAVGSAAGGGLLPATRDPGTAGPFKVVKTKKTGPNGKYTTFRPKELGQNGLQHPVLIWGPGAGAFPEIYQTLLNHVASHGFVIVSYNTTPQGPELTKAVDWIIAESKRTGSIFNGKVDTNRIAMGGQSAGSLGTFKAAKDERLKTTVHINGGTFAPHTQNQNLIRPALFVCGETPTQGNNNMALVDLARPNCDVDFRDAKVPVWYGAVNGSGHTTVIDNPLSTKKAAENPLMKPYLAATTAWLRWQIADDASLRSLFVGPSCGFCTDTKTWTVEQKDLQ